MKRTLLICLSALMILLHSGMPAAADTKVRGKYTSMGQTSESVVYTKGLRQRFEYGADMAVIEQSDLKRMIQLNHQTQTYLVLPLEKGASTEAAPPAAVSSEVPQTAGGGAITQTSTRVDTGERREAFGYTARHVRTTITKEPGQGACSTMKEKTEVDGWYIDLEEVSAYPGEDFQANEAEASTPACRDRMVYEQKGDGKLGYPIFYTMKTYAEDGSASSEMTVEVVELEVAKLEDALFDAPPSYAEARSYQDLARHYSSGSTRPAGSAAGASVSPPAAGGPAINSNPYGSIPGSLGAGANHYAATAYATNPYTGGYSNRYVGPKKAGILRIGVPTVANKTKWQIAVAPYTDQLISFIDSAHDKFEAVPLEASSPIGVENDARKKECDYVLHTTIAELKRELPSKKGAMYQMAAGMGALSMPTGKYETKLDYKLFALGQNSAKLASSVVSKTGSSGGFGWKNALNMGLNVGSMAFMGGVGMGFNPAMMSMFRMSPSLGGMGLGRAMRFDPRMMGMGRMSGMMNPAMLGGMGMGGGMAAMGGMLPMMMGGNGANMQAGNLMAMSSALMAMLQGGGQFPAMGMMGMPFGGSQEQGFDDGGTISDALQQVAKTVVSQMRKKK